MTNRLNIFGSLAYEVSNTIYFRLIHNKLARYITNWARNDAKQGGF